MNSKSKDDLEISIEVTKKVIADLRVVGNPDNGYALAQMLLSEGPDFDSELLILITEGVLELSVQAGSSAAKECLDKGWSILKRAHLRKLQKKQGL